ncbi:hypothetical protein PFISCL1PPCAC_19153, partial [Pristionchus fissidentatus]
GQYLVMSEAEIDTLTGGMQRMGQKTLLDLPDDVLLRILSYLDIFSRQTVRGSRRLRKLDRSLKFHYKHFKICAYTYQDLFRSATKIPPLLLTDGEYSSAAGSTKDMTDRLRSIMRNTSFETVAVRPPYDTSVALEFKDKLFSGVSIDHFEIVIPQTYFLRRFRPTSLLLTLNVEDLRTLRTEIQSAALDAGKLALVITEAVFVAFLNEVYGVTYKEVERNDRKELRFYRRDVVEMYTEPSFDGVKLHSFDGKMETGLHHENDSVLYWIEFIRHSSVEAANEIMNQLEIVRMRQAN